MHKSRGYKRLIKLIKSKKKKLRRYQIEAFIRKYNLKPLDFTVTDDNFSELLIESVEDALDHARDLVDLNDFT